jgi:lipopolysaccharide biosynthesis glycosyltransferase
MDLAQWRQTRALEMLLDYVSSSPDKLHDLDQDALNACFHDRRKRLDYKWNAIRPFFREPIALPLSRDAIETVRRDVRIIHYNGAVKPWSYFCDHPRKADYDQYLGMTEWRGAVPADRTPINILRRGVSRALPRSKKDIKMKAVLPQ